jgi:hypothetical protein
MDQDAESRASAAAAGFWSIGLPDTAASLRQAEYMTAAAARVSADRRQRREKLIARKAAITKATKRLTELDAGDAPYVAVRSGFIRRIVPRPYPPEDRRKEDLGRPPNTQLLRERNPHAHGVLLGGLYAHQMDAARMSMVPLVPAVAADLRQNVFSDGDLASWVTLSGLDWGQPRERRRRLNRALGALFNCNLVSLGSAPHPYRHFGFNCEDGSGHPYKLPSEQTRSGYLFLPVQFFTSGWHLVLSPAHLATFLSVAHQSDWVHYYRPEESGDGVFMADQLRWSHLGLADEAYETIHELEELGLITVVDPMPNRRRGRIRASTEAEGTGSSAKKECYRLRENVFGGRPSAEAMYNSAALGRPAVEVVLEQLAKPAPRFA